MEGNPENNTPVDRPTDRDGSWLRIIISLLSVIALVVLVKRNASPSSNPRAPDNPVGGQLPDDQPPDRGSHTVHGGFADPTDSHHEMTYWWSEVPPAVKAAAVKTGGESNIRKADYSGHAACADCHRDQYESWSRHSHRWMNAEATSANVRGDFSGSATIEYQGGVGSFFKKNGRFRMKLQRADIVREYEIDRTIGSRFYQYYTGRLVGGSTYEPSALSSTEHVLPFGYWLDSQQWVPTVHVDRDIDHDYDALDVYTGTKISPYGSTCSVCHTTRPHGDWLSNLRGGERMSAYVPRPVDFDIAGYLKSEHPSLLPANLPTASLSATEVENVFQKIGGLPFSENGLAFGISCEACHLGGKAHVEASTPTETKIRPYFFPVNPHLYSDEKDYEVLVGRSEFNLNMICARCHSGGRTPYANGTHTWNSTEFTDAAHGFCYEQGDAAASGRTLTCVTCHDPHQGIGAHWENPPQLDSQTCIGCHEQFKSKSAIEAHTHHIAGSAGSHCMDCHMPKINEGLQRMVRTHRIFNPTDPAMIEANQPNACNICHLDKPIDWTIEHLRSWYGEEHNYSERALVKNYPNRGEPVALGWLASAHDHTRLVAAEFLSRNGLDWSLSQLLDLLVEDDAIINRQFTQKGIEESLGIRLRDLGYQFYHPEERRGATIRKLRTQLLEQVKSARN